jgi:succinate dehydrogenase flavin-adding protein (antitoxin of CptAB toxin-antitoxin module)
MAGIDELSRRLDCPESDIRAWQFGQTNMPEEKFLKLVDIVLEMDRDWLDNNL